MLEGLGLLAQLSNVSYVKVKCLLMELGCPFHEHLLSVILLSDCVLDEICACYHLVLLYPFSSFFT